MKYNFTIKFTSQYLQARFSDEAKEGLLENARKTVIKDVKDEDEMWLRFSYFDKNGYYIPGEQIYMALVYSGKDFKMKSSRCNISNYIKANLIVSEFNYLGKKKPDELIVSYVKRKDGSRVKVIHPSFKQGTECDFEIDFIDDYPEKELKLLIENAGKRCGIGARRPRFGRFEVTSFKKAK